MAALTLAGQQVTNNDMLIKGIIDSIVTVNQFYQMLPFKGIHGNALAYNRELAGVDQQDLVDVLDTGADGINKDAQRFSRHSTELTTIIGDAQVNGLVQAVGSDFNDATAIQVASKAKGIGRRYMNLLINGNGTDGSLSLPTLTSTPTLTGTATAALPTVEVFVETISTAVARRTGLGTFVNSSTGAAIGNISTVAGWIADSKTTNVSVTISDRSFAGPFVTGTPTATSFILTASAVALFNYARSISRGVAGFAGLSALATSDGQIATARTDATANGVLAYLDVLIDRVHDKDGMVDYIMMNSSGVRKYTAALRAVSAAGYDDVMEVKMSSGGIMKVQSYRGVPIFRNDFIEAVGLATKSGGDNSAAASVVTSLSDDIYVGTLDDGTFTHGITGLTASKSAGMQVQKLGARENVDADITRVKWYCGLANFSELGLIKGQI